MTFRLIGFIDYYALKTKYYITIASIGLLNLISNYACYTYL